MNELYFLPILFFGIAFLYSMVGFGGGSSYLAALSFFNLGFPSLRALALICNIAVVSNNLRIQKIKKFRKALYYAVASVPMAFLGASIKISEQFFFIALGCSLLVAALLMWFKNLLKNKGNVSPHKLLSVVVGGIIGFVSGLVGIGGGIFLAPVLFIFNFEKEKDIPGICSFFILVNSISALLGQQLTYSWSTNGTLVVSLLVAVLVGGTLGATLSTKKFSEQTIRKLTALLIFTISLNILIKHL